MGNVSLTVDYSNGAAKMFAALPWSRGTTILQVLESAQEVAPGLTVEYGSDRAGQAINLVLDGMAGDEHGQASWQFWVNQMHRPARLGTPTSFGFRPAAKAENEVAERDHILAKFVDPGESD